MQSFNSNMFVISRANVANWLPSKVPRDPCVTTKKKKGCAPPLLGSRAATETAQVISKERAVGEG